MKSLLILCLLTTLIALPIYLFYWNLFRPVLIERLKYRLFKVRDELRLLAINGQIGEKERAFSLVELFCNRAVSRIETIDLSILLAHKCNQREYLEAKRDWEIIIGAGVLVRTLFFEALSSTLGAAMVNSPAVIILIAPIAVLSFTAFWFGRVKVWGGNLLTRALGNICFSPG